MKKNQSLLSRFNMTFIESYKIELEDFRKLTIYIPKRIPRFYEKYKGKEDRLIYALNTLKKEKCKLYLVYKIHLSLWFSYLFSDELWHWYDELAIFINKECLKKYRCNCF